jgi:hypothetical protein
MDEGKRKGDVGDLDNAKERKRRTLQKVLGHCIMDFLQRNSRRSERLLEPVNNEKCVLANAKVHRRYLASYSGPLRKNMTTKKEEGFR